MAFTTQEPLVTADTDGQSDVYVRDRTLATTTLVSVSTPEFVLYSADPSAPKISANGRFVTWNSYAFSPEGWHVFVRDLLTSQTTLVSRSSAGVPGNYISGTPTISGDGRYVAFYSRATNLVADAGGFFGAYVHDRETGETSLVSVSNSGAPANYHSGLDNLEVPSISYDGRYVAFSSQASNLVPSDTNNAEDIFVRDRIRQTTFRATLKSDGAEVTSCSPGNQTVGPLFVLSYDGGDILFSTALPLVHFDAPPGECRDHHRPYIRRLSPTATPSDADGDAKSDVMVYRASTGTWYVRNSSAGYAVGAGNWNFQWGLPGDVPMPGDFDGDGKTDLAVYRPTTGEWYIRNSSQNYAVGAGNWYFQWGLAGDTPITGDFDGDRKVDLAVYRPTTGEWYIRNSSHDYAVGAGNWYFQWGLGGDTPLPADFDGDGKADLAVYRATTGEWYIRNSSQNYAVGAGNWYFQWGLGGDTPLPADFDGDGRTDPGVYRATTGEWLLRLSGQGYIVGAGPWYFQWGLPGDLPRLADFDGDGKADLTVYRPTTGEWFIRSSSLAYVVGAGSWYFQWGLSGDTPLPEP